MPASRKAASVQALDASVGGLHFLNPSRAEALARLGISSMRDLVEHYPRRYLDLSTVASIDSARIGEMLTVCGIVGEVTLKRPKPRMSIVEISIFDGSGVLFGLWFKQPWIEKRVHKGDFVSLSGKVEMNYGFKRMQSPFLEIIETAGEQGEGNAQARGRIIPLHALSEGINAAWMKRYVHEALDFCLPLFDPLPAEVRLGKGLISKSCALRWIHEPANLEQKDAARRRLAFEELFMLQLFFLSRRRNAERGMLPQRSCSGGTLFSALKSLLPFSLSSEQEKALSEILEDMAADRIMERLLLGDVGCGKTVIAALAMAAAVDSGHQCAMMAPTSVLAGQYAAKLGPLFDAAGIRWTLLSSSIPAAQRREILAALASGAISVAFGTHALIQDDVLFKQLALVVVDEQHRFGVDQRSKLRSKGSGCDYLAMSATPIPRTLALTLYGDLDVSIIKRRPVEKAPCKTKLLGYKERSLAYDAIREAVAEGRQAYIICPLVGAKDEREDDSIVDLDEASRRADPKAAKTQLRILSQTVFPQLRLALLTGRMPAEEKDDVMSRFRDGSIDILVSTTVVEVGVDVPNATVMIIEDADRFGVSQLHQLRGRVGRGIHPGTVYLISGSDQGKAKLRLEALEKSQDGFELARYDLESRREGDILGRRQHGLPQLKLADILKDQALLEMAHETALRIIADDPDLSHDEHIGLRYELARLEEKARDASEE